MELDPGLFHRNVCANSDGSISTVSVSFTKSISETGVAEGYVQKDYTPPHILLCGYQGYLLNLWCVVKGLQQS